MQDAGRDVNHEATETTERSHVSTGNSQLFIHDSQLSIPSELPALGVRLTLSIRLVVLLAVSCGFPACGPAEVTPPARPDAPNVVFIMSDTHRWGAMSFTQTPGVQTPNLEALAQQGISLDRYYGNHPLCTPYRAMLMTGRWPYESGLIANHMSLAERVDLPPDNRTRGTLSWAFKDAGYTTAHVGKWHLGGNDAQPFGFDRSIVWSGTNNHRHSQYSIDGGPVTEWTGRSNATAMTSQALEWIEAVHDDPRPFFIIVSLNPPHGPSTMRQRSIRRCTWMKMRYHCIRSTRFDSGMHTAIIMPSFPMWIMRSAG